MEQSHIIRPGPDAAVLWLPSSALLTRAFPPQTQPPTQPLSKTLLDFCVTLIVVAMLAPLLLAIALAIAIDSPGPVIFRQTRGGLGGQRFIMWKFRTMRTGAAAGAQTSKNDPRCTQVGAILRRTSLDEMPQLWNILRGEMSLVGPRPMVAELHLSAETPHEIALAYGLRGQVKPGMTGWAQIHSLRGAIGSDTELRERIKYDLFYIENWSLALDVKILARTPGVVLSGKNAF